MLLLELQLHFMPSRGENTKSNFAKDSASRCSQIWYEPHFISFQLIFVYILENWNHCELAISTLQYKHCLQRFDIWKILGDKPICYESSQIYRHVSAMQATYKKKKKTYVPALVFQC